MNAATPLLIIGEHRIDVDACIIFGPGVAHHVSPQTVAVLKILADHAGEAVARAAIVDKVWHDDPGVDRRLTRCISSLRTHLGDSHIRPRYIETIPGHGYRLIAAVKSQSEAGNGRDLAAIKPDRPAPARLWQFLLELRKRKVSRAALIYSVSVWLVIQIADVLFEALRVPEWALPFVVVPGVLGFPIAVVLAWTFEITPDGLALDIPYREGDTGSIIEKNNRWNIALLAASALISVQLIVSAFGDFDIEYDRMNRLRNADSIIVLPFRATSVNLETKSYAFGVSEQLRYLLRAEFGLDVIAADALTELEGDQIRADLLLEGSVTVSRDAAHVMVQLVDPSDGYDLWSESISVSGTGLTSTQQRMAREILSLLPIGQDHTDGNSDSLVAATRTAKAD